MASRRTESHIRSILKGITWRILATADTILVVMLITCISGNCSVRGAIAIGGLEFLLKFGAYYLHERLWLLTIKERVVSSRLTVIKSVSWRLIASGLTFVIAGFVFESFDGLALAVAIVELFTKFALYYIHERLWLKLPLGFVRGLFRKNS